MILTTEAIILRTMKYSESSLIATLFTRDHGKVSVIAKGARRTTRPFGASLEAMNHVRAIIYHKPQRELQLITQCELVRRHPAILEDLDRMAIGMAAVEILHLSTEHDEPHPEVFNLTLELLIALQNATRGLKNALYVYEIKLLELLGFKPSIRQCVSCKTDLLAQSAVNAQYRLWVTGSGILCGRCGSSGGAGVGISVAGCEAMVGFQEGASIEESLGRMLTQKVEEEIEEALRHLVQVHLTGMRSLKSERVFSRIQH
jgi:DNA repair protein RecO (recombination protein O)